MFSKGEKFLLAKNTVNLPCYLFFCASFNKSTISWFLWFHMSIFGTLIPKKDERSLVIQINLYDFAMNTKQMYTMVFRLWCWHSNGTSSSPITKTIKTL